MANFQTSPFEGNIEIPGYSQLMYPKGTELTLKWLAKLIIMTSSCCCNYIGHFQIKVFKREVSFTTGLWPRKPNSLVLASTFLKLLKASTFIEGGVQSYKENMPSKEKIVSEKNLYS